MFERGETFKQVDILSYKNYGQQDRNGNRPASLTQEM